jgi:protein TonB
MFDTLLESKSKRERSAGGTAASVAAHAAIIGAAVLATAQARVIPRLNPEAIRTVYFPPSAPANPTTRPGQPRRVVVGQKVLLPIDMRPLSLNLPSIDITNVASTPVDFPRQTSGGETRGSLAGVTVASGGAFNAEQVERQASFVAGSGAPRYPEALRSSGVEGKVVALFVVDEKGRAEADSVRILSSDNALFEEAVRRALPRMRFIPAEIGGRKVRQLVQMPFVFTIGR